MWFSVVCNLLDNDTHHYSGQNTVQQIALHHKARALLYDFILVISDSMKHKRRHLSTLDSFSERK